MYIVTYTMREERPDRTFFQHSDWSVHEALEDAEEEYQNLLEHPSTYTASICGVIKSTDYSPAENNKIGDLDRLNQDL